MRAEHGGAFWSAIEGQVDRLSEVVRADVLDAWFPPAPGVTAALSRHLSTICNTSPEVEAECLTTAIAEWRGVPKESVLVGAGASSLIYLFLPKLLEGCQSASTLYPTYTEYPFQIETRLGLSLCRVPLGLPVEELLGSDAVVLPNPNSPCGTSLDAKALIETAPPSTRFWIDETYLEYAGTASVEQVAAERSGTVVVKSLSKTLALSGLRMAYIVAHPDTIRAFQKDSPPWPIGLPAQVAVRAAIEDSRYYANRYADTRSACSDLADSLAATATKINCVLVSHPNGSNLASMLRDDGIYVRELENGQLRVSVRPRPEMWKLVQAFHRVLPRA